MNHRYWLAGAALVATIGLAASVPVSLAKTKSDSAKKDLRYHENINRTFEVGKTPRLSLSNVNGDVEIIGGDGKSIEIAAVKSADSQDKLDDTDVKITNEGDRVRIKVEYDKDRWVHESPARVEFTIHVPRGTRIGDVSLVNGNLKLRDIDGRIDASSVNGYVDGEKLSGNLDVSTVNGSITLAVSGALESVKLHSVNGAVNLYLPKDASARVSASTVHGDIRGGKDLAVEQAHFVGSSLNGVIGKGDGRVDLNTVNGDIRIRREGEKDKSDSRDAD